MREGGRGREGEGERGGGGGRRREGEGGREGGKRGERGGREEGGGKRGEGEGEREGDHSYPLQLSLRGFDQWGRGTWVTLLLGRASTTLTLDPINTDGGQVLLVLLTT